MRISDWSSDVCSSDLAHLPHDIRGRRVAWGSRGRNDDRQGGASSDAPPSRRYNWGTETDNRNAGKARAAHNPAASGTGAPVRPFPEPHQLPRPASSLSNRPTRAARGGDRWPPARKSVEEGTRVYVVFNSGGRRHPK